jgi:hypothetical protein
MLHIFFLAKVNTFCSCDITHSKSHIKIQSRARIQIHHCEHMVFDTQMQPASVLNIRARKYHNSYIARLHNKLMIL